jgi:glycosyltransferase involved in cell wall biosynthesis
MKILLYNIDKGGLKNYSEYLVREMKKKNLNVILSDKIEYYGFDIIHIQFEHTLFRPFGLKLIPILILLKIRGKRIVITSHTVLSKKEIYSRNKLINLIKKIIFPLDEFLMGFLSDKIIVHTSYAKKILMKDYKIKKEKIEVIPIGIH